MKTQAIQNIEGKDVVSPSITRDRDLLDVAAILLVAAALDGWELVIGAVRNTWFPEDAQVVIDEMNALLLLAAEFQKK